MSRFNKLLMICLTLFIVSASGGQESSNKKDNSETHSIDWQVLAATCKAVAVYDDAAERTEKFSSDPATLAAIVRWLESNWDKLYMEYRAVAPKYEIRLVLDNLVILRFYVYRNVDSTTIDDFVKVSDNRNQAVIMEPRSSKRHQALSTVVDSPINWKVFEKECIAVCAYKNGARYGRIAQDRKTRANMVNWLQSNWNKLPLSIETIANTPVYKVTLTLSNAATIDVDIYLVTNVSSQRPLLVMNDLSAIIEITNLPEAGHIYPPAPKDSFGLSRRILTRQ